jgi:serine/threonine protein kinase/Flp pilus assembly protein TadD
MSDIKENDNTQSEQDDSFPTIISAPSAKEIGRKIGPYKLLSVLGEGGFGMVYLAEQYEPVRRRVALKVIKPGMDTKQVIARFEAERQALALLDHPNIAHVFDAGTTEADRPYFALELVKGLPITEHCDQHKLDIEERLELFQQVCDAVQHAHQKGIIHRDLKPSNILVQTSGGKPVPMIIDFGVAKAINQPLTERTLFTEQGQFVGTPEYMSPEQAGITIEDIDTRSDIYSLGIVLYELLTGTLPFTREELKQASLAEILRTIREVDPPHPSTRLSSLGDKANKIAERRCIELATLTKRLHKELEWIPLKAMRKEPDQRYQTASEFAQDVRNYLKGDPLLAGPESATYRLKKAIKRNRALLTGIAAVLVVLLAGIVVSTIFAIGQARARTKAEILRVQAERAREKEAVARVEAERHAKISEAVVDFLKNDLLASVDPEKALGREVTVREVLDAASEHIEGKFKDEPLVEASIHNTLGVTYRKLGKYKAAGPHLERALEICREQLDEEDASTLTSMNSLAVLYVSQGRYDKAETLYVKALEVRRRVLGEEHPDTLRSMHNLAVLYSEQGRYDEAEPLCVKTLEGHRRVFGEEHPYVLKSMNSLAVLYSEQGRYDEAEPLYVKTLEVSRRVVGEEHPDTLLSRNNLAWLYVSQGRYDKAEPLYVKALEVRRRVLGEEHPDTLLSMFNLAMLYNEQGHYDKAEPLLVKALEGHRRVLGEEHPYVLRSMSGLGLVYYAQGRYVEVEALLLKVLEINRRVLGEEHPDTLTSMNNLGSLYCEQARYNKAEPLLVKGLEGHRRVLGEEHPKTLTFMNNLASLYSKRGRYDEAEPLYVKTLEVRRRVLGEEHPNTLTSMNSLGSLYCDQGRYEEAEALSVKALEGRRRALGEEHPRTLESMKNLIILYEAWGKPEQAEEWRAKLPGKEDKDKQ